MDYLRSSASGHRLIARPVADREPVVVEEYHLTFRPAHPSRLPPGILASTYTSKPLIELDGEHLFGELAVLRLLQKDNWRGVWVDTFHDRGSRRLFWTSMPHSSTPFDLATAPDAHAFYHAVLKERGGKAGGFFDVLAWRGDQLIFAEYKGPGDGANVNEPAWLAAALKCGASPSQFYYVSASFSSCPLPLAQEVPSFSAAPVSTGKEEDRKRRALSVADVTQQHPQEPKGGLDRRKISKALQAKYGWVTKSRVDGYVEIWPPPGMRGDPQFASKVRKAVTDLGYSPTVSWFATADGARVVRVSTPETKAQAGRGSHQR